MGIAFKDQAHKLIDRIPETADWDELICQAVVCKKISVNFEKFRSGVAFRAFGYRQDLTDAVHAGSASGIGRRFREICMRPASKSGNLLMVGEFKGRGCLRCQASLRSGLQLVWR